MFLLSTGIHLITGPIPYQHSLQVTIKTNLLAELIPYQHVLTPHHVTAMYVQSFTVIQQSRYQQGHIYSCYKSFALRLYNTWWVVDRSVGVTAVLRAAVLL